MSHCEEYLMGNTLKWPYPVNYGKENEISTDILILGGGIAGCHAAINAAKSDAKVVVVDKGPVITSGAGGSGVDHWHGACTNPCSKVSPDELIEIIHKDTKALATGEYGIGAASYIMFKESYDALLDCEKMGVKFRDEDDEFAGAEFRDEKTKFCFAYDYVSRLHFRIWGTTFKPALYNECKRLGVAIYDRTQATALLTEGGKQGGRVIGATGLNIRTGEFTVFKAKATVICMSRPQRIWEFSTELNGMASLRPQVNMGNGHAMAWRAGAALTQMEKSNKSISGIGYRFPQFGVAGYSATWFACTIVDRDGKEIPFVDRDGNIIQTADARYRPDPGQKFMGERTTAYEYRGWKRLIPDLYDRIKKGEYKLPFYADLPSMPEIERKALWGLMVGEEGKSKIPVLRTYTEAGFDPSKDLLQSYMVLDGSMVGDRRGGPPYLRTFGGAGDAGGVVVDWDMKTTLDGLYAAGDQLFASNFHHHAAVTGRYAGRKAAEYAMQAAEPGITRGQVEAEKVRVYAPVKRQDGIEWKELNAGICRVMQNYCGDPKDGEVMKIGLVWLEDLVENGALMTYATNPHKLGRTLDVLDVLTNSQIIIHASMARKASSEHYDFHRLDYPETDPPEWHKWITVRQENGDVETGEMPIEFAGNLTENYEANNKGYKGWYDTEGKYITGQAKK